MRPRRGAEAIPAARACTLAEALFAIVGLWLAAMAPISFAGGTYDDLLFLRLADHIAHGHWLGPFDQLTLARGPVFPLFLAACALLRVPVNMAAQAVYLAAALLLGRLVGRMLGSRPAATAVFALLSLLPVPYAAAMALVMREKLYVGVTLLALALALRCLPTGPAPARPADLGCAAAAGAAFGLFWLTREEGVWLLPALAAIVALRLGCGLCDRRGLPDARWVAGEAGMLALPVLTFLTVVLPVAAVNLSVYGVFRTDDFQTGPYPAAYGAMLRVEPAHWRRYVFLPRDVRQRLYAVSPAARELEPSLEGAAGREWTRIGCQNSPFPGCDDLQGGWSMFALRSAVTEAGYYDTARHADGFYRRLAGEVDAACAAGRLACTAKRRGMLPPWRWAYVPPLLRSFWQVFAQTVTLRGAAPGAFLTSPSLFDLAESQPLALGPQSPPKALAAAPTVLVMGWTYAPSGTVRLAGVSGPGASTAETTLVVRDNPDIVAAIGHSAGTAARFQWRSRCAPECRLSVTLDAAAGLAALLDRPASELRPGMTALASGVLLNIDAVRVEPAGGRLPDLPLVVASGVARAMRKVSPVAVPLAMAGALAMLAGDLRRRRLRPVTMLAGVLLMALLARMAVIAVADATTVPALEFRFLAPGMVLCWALVGVVADAALSPPRRSPAARAA